MECKHYGRNYCSDNGCLSNQGKCHSNQPCHPLCSSLVVAPPLARIKWLEGTKVQFEFGRWSGCHLKPIWFNTGVSAKRNTSITNHMFNQSFNLSTEWSFFFSLTCFYWDGTSCRIEISTTAHLRVCVTSIQYVRSAWVIPSCTWLQKMLLLFISGCSWPQKDWEVLIRQL